VVTQSSLNEVDGSASGNGNVLEEELLGVAGLSLAAVFPKEVVSGGPVAHGERHAVFEGLVNSLSVVATHRNWLSVLGKFNIEIPGVAKGVLNMVLLKGVNSKGIARTICTVVKHIDGVEHVVSIKAAFGVEAFLGGRIAGMRVSDEDPLVSLHQIEPGAVVASDSVVVTVVISVGVPEVSRLISARRGGKVEGSDTTAIAFGKVDIVLNRAA
jgi:hypothetical protein